MAAVMNYVIPPGTNIAIAGKMGAGKSVCSRLLVEHHGYTRLSFAAPLKTLLQQVRDNDWYNMIRDLRVYPWEGTGPHQPNVVQCVNDAVSKIIGYITSNCGEYADWRTGKGRDFLQALGTDYFRAVHPGIWCRVFEDTLAKQSARLGSSAQFVVDDLRFLDEFDTVTRLGFLTLRCDLAESTRMSRLSPDDKFYAGHVSETALDGYRHQFHGQINTDCPVEEQHYELLRAIELGIRAKGKRDGIPR